MNTTRLRELCDAFDAGALQGEEMRELVALAREAAETHAAASKQEQAFRLLCSKLMPCGHPFEDIIGGYGSVTKCGRCLFVLQQCRKEHHDMVDDCAFCETR